MKRALRIGGMALGGLLLLLGIGVAGLYAWTGAELRQTEPVPTHAFVAPTDSASVARGEHVLRVVAKCSECHGEDLGGKVFIDDPAFGRVFAPNLTRGNGGIAAAYADADFERAIRHGVARDGRRLVIMPSNEFQYLSDDDLGALVAYLKSVPPVDRVGPPIRIGPVARALYVAGQLPLFPAEEVLHANTPVPSVPVDSTVEYGEYFARIGCSGCHGATYGGGKIPGTPPDWPATANLTPTGIGHYEFADFQRVLETGVRPDGTTLHPLMPVAATKLMTPVEMTAVFKYLRTLQPRPFGSR